MSAAIVWGGVCSHTGAMMRAPKAGDGEGERVERVFAAFDELAESLHRCGAQVLVTVATDHFLTFDYANLPVFSIGTGTKFRGHGEFGVPQRDFDGVDGLGEAVHASLVQGGFDVSSARGMPLDHAFACPLQLLFKRLSMPVLPLYVNCTVAPLPTHRRCLELGKALGQALRAQGVVERVAVLGTGGISHWVGTPQTGTINEAFDRQFLGDFTQGRFEDIARWDSDEVIRTAGNGAAEIRNWLVAAGAFGARTARSLAYEPVRAWSTGIGVLEMQA
ncbi:MAG: hypothetical protein KIT86_03845 [Hydrogenophaga sp.]|uniref:DODA-type extradiol aromatic ring-opening family dioxygenase n=1 Tax=Hydrogenophaga sp. TaxID=1904254 RepID=UPI002619500A|nr:hypothetical protein [Hydrogenophaga sp.]MCW5668769.1 hypothetical protein [Hydrogenophaga sp.]